MSWNKNNNKLYKTFTFENFTQALNFTNKIGKIAEEIGHHPTITLTWGKVEVVTTTHDAGNKITEKDEELAKMIDEI